MTIREKMRSLNRESKNGYEVAFMIHYLDRTYYRWELVRYPLDEHGIGPAKPIITFEGRFNWDYAIAEAEKYLNDHQDDGFSAF